MGIRNSRELGENLINITKRLLVNQNLCKLLIYNDLNPLSHEDIKDTTELLHKNIRVVPKVEGMENTQSRIAIIYTNGAIDSSNTEFKDLAIEVLVYVPLEEWVINDDGLRPFLIMSEIESSLKGKLLNGIGRLEYKGFELNLLTEEMSCYLMTFNLDVFN